MTGSQFDRNAVTYHFHRHARLFTVIVLETDALGIHKVIFVVRQSSVCHIFKSKVPTEALYLVIENDDHSMSLGDGIITGAGD
jgi:hypothetical protein